LLLILSEVDFGGQGALVQRHHAFALPALEFAAVPRYALAL